MNTLLKSLVVTALALSAAHVNANTNKTYLAPRPAGQNLPMEMVTYGEMLSNKNEDRFGGNLQVTGFYSKSDSANRLGKYFGVNNKSTFTMVPGGTNQDLDANLIVHDAASVFTTNADVVSVTLKPTQEVYGVRFDYHQDLDKLLEGLYFRAKLPIVNIKNSMNETAAVVPTSSTGDLTTLNNYFNGTYSSAVATAGAQAALTNAKIAGSHSKTTVADLELVLGYTFLDKECYNASINLGLVQPTVNKANGQYVFEEVSGNGGHWALGAGLTFDARVWGDDHHNIKFNAMLDYRYAFEASEKRTLGLVNTQAGQYYGLVSAASVTGSNISLNTLQAVPAANALTLDVDVTPGSNVEFIAGLAYNNGGLSIDVGYDLFWKEDESISRKKGLNGAYYLLNQQGATLAFSTSGSGHYWTTQNNATGGDTNVGGNVAPAVLADTSIDNKAAATPSAMSNKVYGQIGYIFKDIEFPVLVAFGGHYEFASSNAAVQNWGINLKAGISF